MYSAIPRRRANRHAACWLCLMRAPCTVSRSGYGIMQVPPGRPATRADAGALGARKQVPLTMFGHRTLRAQKQRAPRKAGKPVTPAAADALRNNDGGPAPRPPLGPDRPPMGPGGPGQQRPNTGIGWVSRLFLLVLLIVVGYNLYVFFAPGGSQSTITYSYSDFLAQVDSGNVDSVTITDEKSITGKLKSSVPCGGGSTAQCDSFKTTFPFSDDQALQAELN